MIWAPVVLIGIGILVWIISFGAEWMRPKSVQPAQFDWGPDVEVLSTDLDGAKVRYIKVGNGPSLFLFHTLRTQLEIFQNLIPLLKSSFTVYAFDYPGHGWSDLPNVNYHPDQFYSWVERFLDKIDVKEASVAGMSIGGTIVLELAARHNPRIKNAISINPYD